VVRFMGIRSDKDIPQATRIAMVWVVFSLFFAVMSGLAGRVVLGDVLKGVDAETVFMALSGQYFNSIIAGVIIAAILGAIMSTSSSQLLVSASAVTTDFYQAFFNKNASEEQLVLVGRFSVFAVAMLSLLLALDPNNYILDMVAYAWAGFGASFGPLMLFSLHWRRTTLQGAIAGVIVGGITVLLWKNLFAWTGVYEIIPGFFLSALAIYAVSKMTPEPPDEITKMFDRADKIVRKSEAEK